MLNIMHLIMIMTKKLHSLRLLLHLSWNYMMNVQLLKTIQGRETMIAFQWTCALIKILRQWKYWVNKKAMNDKQFICFLSETEGTEKSKVVHSFCHDCKNFCKQQLNIEFTKCTLAITAMTGTAAVNINGETTIKSLLSQLLNIQQYNMRWLMGNWGMSYYCWWNFHLQILRIWKS